MKVNAITRTFSYNNMTLPDPDPSLSPAEVMDFYCNAYPELNQGMITEENTSPTETLYTFSKTAGTKG